MTGSLGCFGTRIRWQSTVLRLFVVRIFPPRDPSYGDGDSWYSFAQVGVLEGICWVCCCKVICEIVVEFPDITGVQNRSEWGGGRV